MGTPGGLAAGTAPTSSGDRSMSVVCALCSGAGVLSDDDFVRVASLTA